MVTLPDFRRLRDEEALQGYLSQLPILHRRIANLRVTIEWAQAECSRLSAYGETAHDYRLFQADLNRLYSDLIPLTDRRTAIIADISARADRLRVVYAEVSV
jgi:hypothetical protein